ncbi:MAG: hypothetical protein R3232_04140 [Clostridia bacterium]|nr:hypothetical protein [Clostridia bacterium]
MKNVLLIILVFVLTLFLVACTNTSKNELPEAIGQVTNEASNNMQDSDNSNDKSEVADLDWPKDRLPKTVPKLKGVTFTAITDIENGIEITFIDCDQNETKMYTYNLEKAGWTFDTTNTEAGKTVMATRQNESLIFFSPIYDDSNDIGTLTYTKID